MRMATVGQAARETGWSPRMLRYLERAGLVVPAAHGSGYRTYGLLELNQLRSLQELRRRFRVELESSRSRRACGASQTCERQSIRGSRGRELSALDWEQRKHERLLAA